MDITHAFLPMAKRTLFEYLLFLLCFLLFFIANFCLFNFQICSGSGKTYTMEGEGKGYNVGISYRTIEKLFNLLQHRAKKEAGSNKSTNEHLSDDNNSDGVQQVLSYNTVSSFKFSMKVGMLVSFLKRILALNSMS